MQPYQISLQFPYRRSHCGFDTLDPDLDTVMEFQYNWEWKDEKTTRMESAEPCHLDATVPDSGCEDSCRVVLQECMVGPCIKRTE